MDISPVTTNYAVEDNSWLDSEHGTDMAVPITLDLAAFDAAHYAEGKIPSGTVLGLITASEAYGPYLAGATDGTETAVGFLLGDVRVAAGKTTGNLGGALHRHGAVKPNRLPFTSATTAGGFLDSAGETDLAAHFMFRTV